MNPKIILEDDQLMAVVKPAEFVIFRIGQKTADA